MGDSGSGCLKNAAIGCGVLLVVAIGLIVAMSFSIIGPLRHASEDRRVLEERFGAQAEYIPSPTGAVTAERIEVFLSIRRDLAEVCGQLTDAEEQILKLESYDGRDDVSKSEIMVEGLRSGRAAMGIGSLIGELYEARNASLVEHGMGLGEFSYIYVIAYQEQLRAEAPDGSLFDGPRFNRRVRSLLADMIVKQRDLASVEAPGLLATLDAEVAALQENDRRLPWQDGLPAPVFETLLPFRAALDAAYCPTSANLELLLNRRQGIAYGSY